MGTFELLKSGADQNFYFRFKSTANGQLLRSEGYVTKPGCNDGIESVKKNAPLDGHYARKNGMGQYTFSLKAANGEIIATSSKVYDTGSARDAAIETIKKEAPEAAVVDLT